MKIPSKLRMAQFFVLGAAFFVLAWFVRHDAPQLSTAAWKAGMITIGAHLGYWIDRRLYHANRITAESGGQEQLRRAILVAAAILAMSLGL